MSSFTADYLDTRLLSLVDENSLFYPQPQRYYGLNEAIRILNLTSPFIMGTIDVPGFSVANQMFYPVPAGFIYPTRVEFNGKQLSKVSLRSLTMRYRNFATDKSNQGQPVQEWFPCGLTFFGIHPMDSLGGQTISVTGVLEPTPLVAPTDTVQMEDEWVTTVINLAFCAIILKESAAEFASLSMVYQGVIRDLKNRIDWASVRFGRYFLLTQGSGGGAS